jgi:hypothetical protein
MTSDLKISITPGPTKQEAIVPIVQPVDICLCLDPHGSGKCKPGTTDDPDVFTKRASEDKQEETTESVATTETGGSADNSVSGSENEDESSADSPHIELERSLQSFRTPSAGRHKRAHAVRLSGANLGIVLAEYQDLFSDFDPRPWATADLSRDFIRECYSRIAKLAQDDYELRLLIPRSQQDVKQETTILKRVSQHFADRYVMLMQKTRVAFRFAILWCFVGLTLMFLSAMAYDSFAEYSGMQYHLVSVILDPAGWFLVWSGLDKIYESYKSRNRVKKARKMTQLSISFLPYGSTEAE